MSNLPRVLVDRDAWTRDEDWDRLAACAELVEMPEPVPETEPAFIETLRGFRGALLMRSRLPVLSRAVLEALPELKIIGLRSDRFGTGVDLEAATECGIVVVDADNISSAAPVAEWDLALMLLCLRNAGAVYRQMISSSETWGSAGNAEFVCGELTGRRVGLVGCGHVGQRLIELLQPFRVDLRVCDPYLPEETAARLGIVRNDLEGVLRHAEILVVQVPHTPRTEHLIGARELELLGTGKILINCSRGKVLDQAALIRKLEAGELIAGLDVFDPEPLEADSPLRRLPNVFLTPHIAWYAPDTFHRYFQNTALDFERFFRGEPLHYALTRRMADIRHGRE